MQKWVLRRVCLIPSWNSLDKTVLGFDFCLGLVRQSWGWSTASLLHSKGEFRVTVIEQSKVEFPVR